MSLILDALNRSRQDSEQVPGLASHHTAAPAQASSEGGIGLLQWLLVLGLALAVLAIGWLLLDRMPPATVPPAEPVATLPAAQVRPVPQAQAEPVHTASSPTVPAARQIAAPPAQQDVQTPVAAAMPAPAQERAASDQISTPSVDPSVAALYQQEAVGVPASATTEPSPERKVAQTPVPAPPEAGAEEEAIDIEKLVAQAQAELADAKLQDTGVPFLATLSQQTKDSIPSLMYQRHDYSGKPGKSRVLINGKTLTAGASVRGVKIVEILPESVVLEFQGTRFRLRALNSWVNL